MAESKIIRVGDFEYFVSEDGKVSEHAYVGPTGPGSVLVLRDSVEINGESHKIWTLEGDFELENLMVEKVVLTYERANLDIKNMPILKEVELVGDSYRRRNINDCPELQTVVVTSKLRYPIHINDNLNTVKVVYNGEIWETGSEVAEKGTHVVFGDDVEKVCTIRGGHVTLGKSVKKVTAMKKADFGIDADTMVPEYELPTRIDFLYDVPPEIGSVAPGAMTVAELHVPAGALDAYMSHAQWGKAAYFVDADGKTVDKYAAKHKARMKKLQKEREEAEAKAAEEAKAEKVKAMDTMMHTTLAPQRLAKWNPGETKVWYNTINIPITIGVIGLEVSVPKDAPIDIWDKIVARLEEIEAKQKAQGL